ncbi:nucleotidyl transferase AbiEii/AbiGii toxin family protein [Enterobacter sp. Cy-643]|uniref:nucleotidyl transferase AbiEii/AbiGii toxin family protein n=1 Tax=Enterobacter sp. Cy-643 TaxID=2608346 RepID=UPI00141F5AF0|nr:nucleotidyl transferase AbiEii/AbiGii toxin family protein [Enterobacter sp. Cy-643]NIF31796.1 nucleotidyl transferase AbiEii/AbiGii toxin family protein [Enterobacter sp. Cy-643]
MNDKKSIPNQNCWESWNPDELACRLGYVSKPWCVVGGWALDLWHGAKTREHEDIEFTILREDFSVFRQALAGMEFFSVNDGVLTRLAEGLAPGVYISQIWCFDRSAGYWRADMMLEPGTPENWVYKRDRQIKRHRDEMVGVTTTGIPYLNPSAVLLFKAKYSRAKDKVDFFRAAPRLSPSECLWLQSCLEHQHLDHVWLTKL